MSPIASLIIDPYRWALPPKAILPILAVTMPWSLSLKAATASQTLIRIGSDAEIEKIKQAAEQATPEALKDALQKLISMHEQQDKSYYFIPRIFMANRIISMAWAVVKRSKLTIISKRVGS